MLKTLVVALVVTSACTEPVQPTLDGTTSNPDLQLSAYVSYETCSGTPCTSVDFNVQDVTSTVTNILDATGSVSVDGEPPIAVMVDPDATHPYHVIIDHWIHHVRVDVTAGPDIAAVWADDVLETPDDDDVSLPATVVLGAGAELRWTAQDGAAETIVFSNQASQEPTLSVLKTLAPDEGHHELGPELLEAVGTYKVVLDRMIVHEPGAAGGLYLEWDMESQQQLDVIEPPPS